VQKLKKYMNRIYFNGNGISNFHVSENCIFINLKNNNGQITVLEDCEVRIESMVNKLKLMLRNPNAYVAYYDYNTNKLVIE